VTALPSIGFLGYGRLGRALGDRFRAAGAVIAAHDPAASPSPDVAVRSPADLASRSQVVIVAVPVALTGPALNGLAPCLTSEHLVFDVGSVKEGPVEAMSRLLGTRVPWAGSHPLFGPTSLALGDHPLRAVVCPAPGQPAAAGRVRDLYAAIGCEVHEESAARHDEIMAESHALAYFVARGFLDAGIRLDSPFLPPSAQAIARAVEAMREDAGHLFASVHRQNRHAPAARRRLLKALVEADEGLAAAPDQGEEPHREPISLAIPDLGERSPLLREVREVIDDIDSRILELLARRAAMARRARFAKAELGHDVVDPRRERELLENRRERASRLDLPEEAVERVFEAILGLSRRVQEEGR
jgi:prephenate dehydrogenase